MNAKDLLTITAVALGTATLTVMTFWPGPLDAENEANALAAKIAKPQLVANGVEISLAAAEGKIFKAGDEPVLELTAHNPACEAVNAPVHITMSAISPVSPLSRMVPMPTMLWQQDQTLALKAKESIVIKITTNVKLPPNKMISISLAEVPQSVAAARTAQRAIVAMSFSTSISNSPAGAVVLNRPAAVNAPAGQTSLTVVNLPIAISGLQ